MGGTQSRSTTDILNEMAINVSMDSIMSCTSVATQQQLIELENIEGNVVISDVSMKQGASIDMSCVMKSEKQNQIATDVANAIAQHAESKGQAALSALGNTKSIASANIKTEIQQNITANTEVEMSAHIEQIQKIGVANVSGSVVIKNVSMEQSAEIVARALMQSSAYSSVINESATKIDQVTQSEEENPIAGIIDSVGGVIGEVGGAISGVFTAPILMIGALLLGLIALFVVIRFAFNIFKK